MNIYDIAKRAEVSIATVSRVLNDSPHVSEQTRRRVLEVIESEGYVPNAFARGLGLDTMRMIGVMCTDITDPFYARAVGCVENLLRQRGMDTVLCCCGSGLEDKKKKLSDLVNRRVDAVLLIGSAFKEKTDNTHIRDAARELPVFIINGYISLPGVFCVVCDERGAVRGNVGRLYRKGCRRILYLYDAVTYSGSEKLEGYAEGCADCGLTVDPALTVRTGRSVDAAAETVRGLLAAGTQFDAVMTAEDLLAAGAMKALRERGKRLPVIGFNNSVIAECTAPALTSVDNMIESMCETTVRLLSDLENGKDIPNRTVISARLIERETFCSN